MLNKLLLQCIIGTAVTYWFTQLNWFSLRPFFKFPVIIAILSYILYTNFGMDTENYYELLGVPPSSSKQTIKTAYQQLLKAYDPRGANLDYEEAQMKLDSIRAAANVLLNNEKRKLYDQFGDAYASKKELNESEIMQALIISATLYLLLFTIGYICTIPRSIRGARTFLLIYAILFYGFEVLLRFSYDEEIDFSWTFLYPTFELVQFGPLFYPFFLILSITVFNYFYFDKADVDEYILKCILSSNRVLLERVNQLQASTAHLRFYHKSTLVSEDMENAEKSQNILGEVANQIKDHETQSATPNIGNEPVNPQVSSAEFERLKDLLKTLSVEQKQLVAQLIEPSKVSALNSDESSQLNEQAKGSNYIFFVILVALIWFYFAGSET